MSLGRPDRGSVENADRLFQLLTGLYDAINGNRTAITNLERRVITVADNSVTNIVTTGGDRVVSPLEVGGDGDERDTIPGPAPGGGVGGSSMARVWVSAADPSLPYAVNMGALGAGTLQQTVTAGVSTPTAFAGAAGSVPFYAANSQLAQDNANFFFNNATKALTLGGDVLLTRAGTQSFDKTGSGSLFFGNSVAGGSLTMYTSGGAGSSTLTMDSAGKLSAGGATGLVWDPANIQMTIGTSSPAVVAAVEVVKSVNTGCAFAFVNPNTGGSAYTAFFLGQAVNLSTRTFGMFLFSSGGTFGVPYTANAGLIELAGGSSNMHFWIQQNAGDFVWYTRTTFPNPPERMRLTNLGVLSVNDLGAAGTGRLVKAAVTTGILSIASAADVAGAITWPTVDQILFSSGTTTAPSGNAGFKFMTNLLAIGAGNSQGWFNLGNDGSGAFEEVAAYWSGNQFFLQSLAGGGGTVRPMRIDSGTAGLTLQAGAAGMAITSGGVISMATPSVTITAETGGTGHNLTITGNNSDSIFNATAFESIGLISTHNSAISLDDSASLQGSPTIASAAPVVTVATVLTGGVTITGTTTIAAFHAISIPQPGFAKGDAGGVTVTSAASLYIENSPNPGGSVTITNRYALWVDAGIARFDGNATPHVFELPADATGNVSAATGRIPCIIGGATKYLRYYND